MERPILPNAQVDSALGAEGASVTKRNHAHVHVHVPPERSDWYIEKRSSTIEEDENQHGELINLLQDNLNKQRVEPNPITL